ncbi:hypothetical protein ACFXAF_12285 [Kitasatospora sp. NPDC059463]|uniref:hypothetical protein n=1 Tax=unclassified Kitasatospora TaxID=2633591 RepID=UPI0036A0683E
MSGLAEATTGSAAIDRAVLWAVAVTAITGAAAVGWRVVRAFGRLVAAADEVADDWRGTPDRPGVPGRPGVVQRIAGIEASVTAIESRVAVIEHELHPNSGASLRDAVDRVEAAVVPTTPTT